MRALFALLLLILVSSSSVLADSLREVLSRRHLENTSAKDLEQVAGGEDALVQGLLALRSDDSTPGVSVRAAGYLLEYSARIDVQKALLADVEDLSQHSTAALLAFNLDRIPDSALRVSLAKKLIARVDQDKQFAPYLKALKRSTDPLVKSLVK